MSVVVDALGKQCPIPIVMAKKALAELQTPDTLEILVDNEAAVQNLSKLAASCQLPVRAEKTGEKRFSVTMEVCAPVQPAAETVCAPDECSARALHEQYVAEYEAYRVECDRRGECFVKYFADTHSGSDLPHREWLSAHPVD